MAAFLNACRFNPTAGGTADWTYSSAVNGYQSPTAANVVNGRLYKYRVESGDLSQWELGEGVYNTGTGVLARTTILFNSAGGTSKINFSTIPQVAIVALREDLISIEEANNFTSTQQIQARRNIGAPLKGHLFGLTMSTAGASTTLTVAAGEAADNTGARNMALGSSIAKTTAAWAVGTAAGGLDTGSIASNTWYHFYLVTRVDTGVVDVVFSTNASSPTLPANYTLFRRIGSARTDGASQWRKFVQVGDEFLWDTPVNDANSTSQSTTAVLYTLTVPQGVQVLARIRGYFCSGVSIAFLLVSSPDEASAAVLGTTGNVTATNMSTSNGEAYHADIRTNTSGQIRAIANVTLSLSFTIATYGWFDRRGRDG